MKRIANVQVQTLAYSFRECQAQSGTSAGAGSVVEAAENLSGRQCRLHSRVGQYQGVAVASHHDASLLHVVDKGVFEQIEKRINDWA